MVLTLDATVEGAGSSRKLHSIQYLRGLAALIVVVYHSSYYLGAIRGEHRFEGWDALGLFGVAIFFAISGYLMATLVRSTDPWRFMAHRLIRIYPMLFIVVAVFAPLFALSGARMVTDPLALSLIPAGPRIYPLSVEWTLVFEVSFYLMIFVVALAGVARRLDVLAMVWLALLAAMTVWKPELHSELLPPVHRLPVINACAGFAAGLLIPMALRREVVPRWSLPAGIALAVALAVAGSGSRWWAGFISALIVAGAIRIEAAAAEGTPIVPLKKLGDWSYALYLCHVPVLILTYRFAPAAVNPALLWLLAIFAAIAMSAPLGAIDVRLYRWTKGVVDRRCPTPLRISVALYVALYGAVAVISAVQVVASERREAQEVALLDRLNPESLRDPAAVDAAITTAFGAPLRSIRGQVAEVVRLQGGVLAVRGWLVDLEDPGRSLSVAVFQNGARIGLARPWRRRPDIAGALGRPEIAAEKIGFGFGTTPIQCADGNTVVVLAVDSARGVVNLPGKVQINGCPGSPGTFPDTLPPN